MIKNLDELIENVKNGGYKVKVEYPKRPEGYKRENYVYDENKSVKWNREHREKLEKACFEGNYACKNFMNRRKDFKYDFPYKIYYGKVGNLGYVVSEDELEDL